MSFVIVSIVFYLSITYSKSILISSQQERLISSKIFTLEPCMYDLSCFSFLEFIWIRTKIKQNLSKVKFCETVWRVSKTPGQLYFLGMSSKIISNTLQWVIYLAQAWKLQAPNKGSHGGRSHLLPHTHRIYILPQFVILVYMNVFCSVKISFEAFRIFAGSENIRQYKAMNSCEGLYSRMMILVLLCHEHALKWVHPHSWVHNNSSLSSIGKQLF